MASFLQMFGVCLLLIVTILSPYRADEDSGDSTVSLDSGEADNGTESSYSDDYDSDEYEGG